MTTCNVCHGTGTCPGCSGHGRIGDFKFSVRGGNAADVERVAGRFIAAGFEHLAAGSRGEAVIAGYKFEREVAALFRALGAEVEVDVGLAGSQIDILMRETTSSGSAIKVAVECKALQRPVGVQAVVSFAGIAQLLRGRGLIDRAVMVSKSGYSRHAKEAAAAYTVELIELEELERRALGLQASVESAERELEIAQTSSERSTKRVFVVMPFAEQYQDLYLLGIREVAESLGLVVERADEIDHTTGILDIVKARIRAADAVIGETSTANPNVFYEIGYAHALDRPTILIAREGTQLPFDVASVNHIMYNSLVHLRSRLKNRLAAVLSSGGDNAVEA